MRFSWFSRHPERRRRGAALPLAVRRLERRRVLNAQITSMVVPAMVAEGDTVTATATGTGFGQLYFFWSVKQSSTTIASGSGPTFDFTVPDDGTYDVKLQLFDSAQGNDTEVQSLVVTNVVPQITNLTALNVNENSFTTLTGSIVDPGTKDTFTLDVDWGDGTAETFTYAAGTKDFSETHQYLDDNPTGTPSDPYTINVKLKDDDTGEDVDSRTITVSNVAPSLTLVDEQERNEGELLDLSGMGDALSLGTFSDIGSVDTHTAVINWGDGTSDSAGMIVESNGSGTIGGSHTYADNGTYTVTVRVADDDMSADFTHGIPGIDYIQQTFLVTVHNVDPFLTDIENLQVNEGQAFALTADADAGTIDLGVGLADPGFDNLLNAGNVANGGEVVETFTSMTIDWGDGTALATVSIINRVSGSPGILTTAGFDHAAHTYADNGVYAVSITVQDDDGPVVSLQFTIMVHNVAPALAVVADQTVNESDTLVLTNLGTISDPGFDNPANPLSPPGGSRETFTFWINWDDGTAADAGIATIDDIGSVTDLTDASFDGSHTYADNGTYTVTVRVADDDMSANFTSGIAGTDFIARTFKVTVNNIAPQFEPFDGVPFEPGQDLFQGDDVTASGLTMIRAAFSDPGFDNPLNAGNLSNGGETAETFTYLVDWGDGTVDTIEVIFVSPGAPLVVNSQTRVFASMRDSGDATTWTTGSFEVQHRYLGPPDPLHPTAPITIALTIMDDDGDSVRSSVEVSNPGIETVKVAIDTTPVVPRLELPQPARVNVFVDRDASSAQSLQTPEVRVARGELANTSDRYLELRVVYPDGGESESFRLKDEVLFDLRRLFATLPDGRYRIFLIRTENNSRRLVIEVDVRNGRVIDTSDDSEGTRDRPPTSEGVQQIEVVPLEANPPREQPPEQPEDEAAGGPVSESAAHATIPPQSAAVPATYGDELVALPPVQSLRWVAPLAAAGLAANGGWSQRVMRALEGADERAWQRLRRAGRLGRTFRRCQTVAPPANNTNGKYNGA